MRFLERLRRRRALASIRRELRAWGLPADNLTDAGLVESVAEFGRALARTGVTCERAAEALRCMASAIPDSGELLSRSIVPDWAFPELEQIAVTTPLSLGQVVQVYHQAGGDLEVTRRLCELRRATGQI